MFDGCKTRYYKSKEVTQMDRNQNVSSQIIGSNQAQPYQEAVQMPQQVSSILPLEQMSDANIRRTISVTQKIASNNEERRRSRQGMRSRRKNRLNKIQQWQQEAKNKPEGEQCQVCFDFCDKKDIQEFGKCGHKYCKKCLHQHINSSINAFKTVNCLSEECREALDITSPHIRSLALPLQQKYYKIMVFLNLSKDQDIRMCPTDNCQGFIKMSQARLECPICCVSFCKFCMLPKHKGSCDQNGVLYMQDNYLFRRCRQCRMVLEKNQGCNHMTCKCGYQFCYLCGEKWAEEHQCKPKAAAQRLPDLMLPQTLPSVSVVRNNQSSDMRRSQEQQRVNARQPMAAQAETTCFSCVTSALKTILIVILLIPFQLITLQMLWTIMICLVIPILYSICLLFYSLLLGLKMMSEQSCLKIVCSNIVLYLYHVITCYYKTASAFFRDWCEQKITLIFLFPISYQLHPRIRNCLQ